MTVSLPFLAQWQADYDKAVGAGGTVVDVIARMGRFGGIAIWVEVNESDGPVYYSPYFNQSPGDGEHIEDGEVDQDGMPCSCESCQFEDDPDAWLDGMVGATDWGDWDWGSPEFPIPAH